MSSQVRIIVTNTEGQQERQDYDITHAGYVVHTAMETPWIVSVEVIKL